MRRVGSAVIALWMGCALTMGQAAGRPVEDASSDAALYGALPAMQWPVLSPSGDAVAYVRNQVAARALAVLTFATGEEILIGLPEARPTELLWASDDRLLIELEETQTFRTSRGWRQADVYSVMCVARDGSEVNRLMRQATQSAWYTGGNVVSGLPDDPDHALVSWGGGLQKAHLTSGRGDRVGFAPGHGSRFVMGEGHRASFLMQDEGDRVTIRYQAPGDEAYEPFLTVQKADDRPLRQVLGSAGGKSSLATDRKTATASSRSRSRTGPSAWYSPPTRTMQGPGSSIPTRARWSEAG